MKINKNSNIRHKVQTSILKPNIESSKDLALSVEVNTSKYALATTRKSKNPENELDTLKELHAVKNKNYSKNNTPTVHKGFSKPKIEKYSSATYPKQDPEYSLVKDYRKYLKANYSEIETMFKDFKVDELARKSSQYNLERRDFNSYLRISEEVNNRELDTIKDLLVLNLIGKINENPKLFKKKLISDKKINGKIEPQFKYQNLLKPCQVSSILNTYKQTKKFQAKVNLTARTKY
jgi:hypothetical protein